MKFHTMKKGLRQAASLTINVRCLKFHTMKFNSKGVQSQIASLPIRLYLQFQIYKNSYNGFVGSKPALETIRYAGSKYEIS